MATHAESEQPVRKPSDEEASDLWPTLPPDEITQGAKQQNTVFHFFPGAQPIPGYTLQKLLGKGGFGEVWKALGPGGIALALKSIRLADERSKFELRALELIKSLRHLHLLSLFGYWQSDNELVIAMELADGTVQDRLKEVALLPREEALRYVREAAEALDYLNEQDIQHRDVKPGNLLLVGGHVKVGDFGLAKLLEHSLTTASGCMTPAYAPPELFDNKASRRSDQYSLAVTYYQMRTGRLPFEGSLAQIVQGHLYGSPDWSAFSEKERSGLERAMAKQPGERWPSCLAFFTAINEASTNDRFGLAESPKPIAVSAIDSASGVRVRRPVQVGDPAAGQKVAPAAADIPGPEIERVVPDASQAQKQVGQSTKGGGHSTSAGILRWLPKPMLKQLCLLACLVGMHLLLTWWVTELALLNVNSPALHVKEEQRFLALLNWTLRLPFVTLIAKSPDELWMTDWKWLDYVVTLLSGALWALAIWCGYNLATRLMQPGRLLLIAAFAGLHFISTVLIVFSHELTDLFNSLGDPRLFWSVWRILQWPLGAWKPDQGIVRPLHQIYGEHWGLLPYLGNSALWAFAVCYGYIISRRFLRPSTAK